MERIPWRVAVRRPQLSLMNFPKMRQVTDPRSINTPLGDPSRTIAWIHSELYPFVFFTLQNRSKK